MALPIFMTAWVFWFFVQEKFHAHKIPRLGGGVFWFWGVGGGGSAWVDAPESLLSYFRYLEIILGWGGSRGESRPQCLATKDGNDITKTKEKLGSQNRRYHGLGNSYLINS